MTGSLTRVIANLLMVSLCMGITMDYVLAQSDLPDSIPQNVMPGVLDTQIQKNLDDPAFSIRDKQLKVDVNPDKNIQESIKIPTFKLEEIQFRNASLLNREELAPVISPLLGKDVSETELLQVSRQITEMYHKKGYKTSRAFLPSQKVVNGVVIILAQENRVGNISVDGIKSLENEWVLKQITLKNGDFYNVDQLEQDLKQLKRSPQIQQVRANIKPSEKIGFNDTVIEIVEVPAIRLITSMDNTGREGVGNIRYNTTLVKNNLFKPGHQLIMSYTGASGFHSMMSQYSVPLNEWGWTAGLRASLGKTLIGGAFDFLDVTGRSDIYTLYTSIPLLKKERLSLTGDLGFNAKTSNTFIYDQRIDANEQDIRSLSMGLNLSTADRLGGWSIGNRMDVTVGNQAHFVKLHGDMMRTIRLPKNIMLILKTEGQYSPENLPGMEQMQVGGFSSVRGYSEGFLIADSGFILGSELRLPFWGFPKEIQNNLEWLLFAEGGNVYLSEENDPTAHGAPGNIMSLGLGLRGQLSKYLTGRLDVGFAQHIDQDEPTARLHFGISGMPF